MNSGELAALFALARASIAARLRGEAAPELPAPTPNLTRAAGVFVTLKIQGTLRGCIGFTRSAQPLSESVRALAPMAAFEDSRFQPLSLPEEARLELQLSILSPPERLSPSALPEGVRVGVHGVVVRCAGRQGLLLPQVARERGWGSRAFLEATSRKAGLPPGAWQEPGAEVFVFTSEVYEEEGRT